MISPSNVAVDAVALLGSVSIAYHEVFRGRRTGTCIECGRLNHASATTCLCGGDVEENPHPDPDIEAYDTAQYDSLARVPHHRNVFLGAFMLSAISGVVLVLNAMEGAPLVGAAGIVLLGVAKVLPDNRGIGNVGGEKA